MPLPNARELAEAVELAGRERLLDQLDAERDELRAAAACARSRSQPSLASTRSGRSQTRAMASQALEVARAADLDLEPPVAGLDGPPRAVGRAVDRVDADRVRRLRRASGEPEQTPRRLTAELADEIVQRARRPPQRATSGRPARAGASRSPRARTGRRRAAAPARSMQSIAGLGRLAVAVVRARLRRGRRGRRGGARRRTTCSSSVEPRAIVNVSASVSVRGTMRRSMAPSLPAPTCRGLRRTGALESHAGRVGLVVDLDAVVVVGQRERAAVPGRSVDVHQRDHLTRSQRSEAAGAACGSPARSAFQGPGGLGPACRAATRRRRRARRGGPTPSPSGRRSGRPRRGRRCRSCGTSSPGTRASRAREDRRVRGGCRHGRPSSDARDGRPGRAAGASRSLRARRAACRTGRARRTGPQARSRGRPCGSSPKYAVRALRDFAGVSGLGTAPCSFRNAASAARPSPVGVVGSLCPATRAGARPEVRLDARHGREHGPSHLAAATGRDEPLRDGVIDPSESSVAARAASRPARRSSPAPGSAAARRRRRGSRCSRGSTRSDRRPTRAVTTGGAPVDGASLPVVV